MYPGTTAEQHNACRTYNCCFCGSNDNFGLLLQKKILRTIECVWKTRLANNFFIIFPVEIICEIISCSAENFILLDRRIFQLIFAALEWNVILTLFYWMFLAVRYSFYFPRIAKILLIS